MTTSTPFPLEKAIEARRFGNKAASLARLLGAGIGTAPGVVLGVEALQAHLVRLGIAERVAALFLRIAAEEPGDVRTEAFRLRQAVSGSRLPADLVRQIAEEIEDGAVYAVRSSAPGEDGAVMSFAGQFDSVLGCRSLAEIENAVCAVWASLFGDRAVAYALHRRFALQGMGVIIQRQVDAAVSGVMFTRDPRDSSGEQLIVEYCAGLGERLVSGWVSPGRLRIGRNSGGIRVEAEPDEPVSWNPGVTEVASALRGLADRLETLYGSPQDVEWSLDRTGQLVVLQARPVTGGARQSAGVVWTNANIAENFPDPVVPMLRSFVGRGYTAYFGGLGRALGISQRRMASMAGALDNLVGCHAGRLYYNLSNIHAVIRLAPGGAWLTRYFNQFTGAREFPEPRVVPQGSLPWAIELLAVAQKVVWRYVQVGRGLRRFERRVDAYAARSAPARLSGRRPSQLADLMRGFLQIRLERWTDAALADTAAMVCYGILQRLLRGRKTVSANDLLKGLPGLASAIPVERLWALSRELRRDDVLAAVVAQESAKGLLARLHEGEFPAFRDALNSYLDTWGFRSSGELMLSRPTPAEDPLPVLRLLKSYAAADGEGPEEISHRQAQARRQASQEARRQLGLPGVVAFPLILKATQGAICLRERARMKQALLYTRLRHVALALGGCLVRQGVMDQPDDILFLDIEQAIALGEGKSLAGGDVRAQVARARLDLSAYMALTPPDSFVLPEGEDWRAEQDTDADDAATAAEGLSGTGACGGRVSGRAAVVLDVAEIDRIARDQVLVTRQTDPGWAAVFFMVRGIVIERGGLLSHGAIIAREYGIPAVVGVRDATRLIEDGQMVCVDGDRGRVEYAHD